jgi:hypothetical protein
MNREKSFWSFNRRDLFKILPSGIAAWAVGSAPTNGPISTPAPTSEASASGAKKWLADWIWEPLELSRSDGAPGVPFFQNRAFKNLFTYFRKTFDQSAAVNKAVAHVSADSRYRLYVNGHYVGRGPARFDPTWPYYDEYDITSLLRPGKNSIAALVHYYGERTGWYLPKRPGLLVECRVEGGGGTTLIKSDATWKFLRVPTWTQSVPRVNGALGFTELYDARQEVEGWNLPEYDDSHWQPAHIVSRISRDRAEHTDAYNWNNTIPRDIPMLLEKEVVPAQVSFVGEVQNLAHGAAPSLAHQMSQESPGPLQNCTLENAQSLAAAVGGGAVIRTTSEGTGESPGYSAVLVLDFGRELTAYPRLEVDGVAGGIIDMGVCESLGEGRVTPTRNGLHFNRFIMRDGPQRWEAFEWDGFRYLQLTIRNCPRPVKIRKVAVNFTSYPVGNRGSFESSDSMLNKIWETSRYTVQLCMHDGYEDCPNREQRQWVGDAYVETKANYAAFGDTRLAAKYLRQIAQSQFSDGRIQMFWPGDDREGVLDIFDIKDFVLHWISTIWEYYRFTGDQNMVRELFPNVEKALGWFERRVDAQGLLDNIPPWVFGDWAPLDRRDHNTILNALFCNVLRESAQMAALVGNDTARQRYDVLAGQVKAGINKCLWDERRGVYVDSDADGVTSSRVSQQSNSMCLLYDIAPPQKRSGILAYIFDPQRIRIPEMYHPVQEGFDNQQHVVQSQPYFMHWVNAALAHIGEHERMVRQVRDLFGKMIEAGATTIWETWSRTASECHGWSGTVAYDLPTYVLGVRGTAPGFSRFVIEPHPAQLEWARGVFPSVKGDIPVSWRSAAGEFQIEGSVPEATAASVLIPPQGGKSARQVRLNGQLVWESSRPVGAAVAKAEAQGVRVQPSRGMRYKIEARYEPAGTGG